MDNGTIIQEQFKKGKLEEQKKSQEEHKTEDNSFLHTIFNKPKIIGLVANTNEGKTNTLYYFLDYLAKRYTFKVFTYGFKMQFENTIEIHSVEELEQIKDSFIIIDEMFTLFDLDNKKIKA